MTNPKLPSERQMKLPRWLKVLGIVATHVGAVVHLFLGVREASAWWQVALGMFLGLATLDLITLLVHWTIDNYFSPDTPLIGTSVYYFREHHELPLKMFSRGYVDNNFENAMIGLSWQLLFAPFHLGPVFLCLTGFGTLLSGYITLIHRWAHTEAVAWPVRALQSLGLLVSKAHHDVHHEGQGRNYGLCAGFFDPVFDALRVLEALETIVLCVTGAAPLYPRTERGRRARGEVSR